MAHITLNQLSTILGKITEWASGKFPAKNANSGKLEYGDMPVVVLALMGPELDGEEIAAGPGSTYFLPAGNGVGARIMYRGSYGSPVKISDPVSGVIYCNAHTDLLYRWDDTQKEMIPVGGVTDGSIDVSRKADLLADANMLSPSQWPKVVLRNVTDDTIPMPEDLNQGDVTFDSGFLWLQKASINVNLGAPSKNAVYLCLADNKLYRWSGSSFTAIGVDTYTKAQIDTALAGKVSANGDEYLQVKAGAIKGASAIQGVIVNGTEVTKDNNDKVSITVPQGESGITPHIDAVTGHWFIGDEDTNVPATGPQGNSGVASGDDVVVVNNLNGEPDDLQTGQVAVLSAEQGKYLGDRALIGTGIFGDAYDKAMAMNVPFPWLLNDTDDNGNRIKKMMWHVGNGEFVDAIGGSVDGDRNGLTVVCINPCVMRIYNLYAPDARDLTHYEDYTLHSGVNFFPLSEVAEITQSNPYRRNTIRFFETSESSTELLDNITKIDFGGMEFMAISNGGNILHDQSELVTVKRLKIINDDYNATWPKCGNALSNCPKLAYLDVSGSIKYSVTSPTEAGFFGFLKGPNSLRNLDLGGLKIDSNTVGHFLNYNGLNSSVLQTLDVSGIDFSVIEILASFCMYQDSLTTVIVGNFSNTSATNIGNLFNVTGKIKTLVCTTQNPPDMSGSKDMLGTLIGANPTAFGANGNGKILVPPGRKSLYTAATGWSTYADFIEEFNEGDYVVIDNTSNSQNNA